MQADPARTVARVAEAERVILDLLESAAARLDGAIPQPDSQCVARTEALLKVENTPTLEEAKQAAIFGGFVERQSRAFHDAPGLPTMLVAARSSSLPERDTCFPMPEVLRAGLAMALASDAMRTSVLRLNRWLHSAFLLDGGRYVPAFSSPAALWLLVAIELRSYFWSETKGIEKLRSFAGNEAAFLFADAPVPPFADQLILCELGGRIVSEGSNLGPDLPLASLPLASAPRFAFVDAPLDEGIIPIDFAPYFNSPKKAVA